MEPIDLVHIVTDAVSERLGSNIAVLDMTEVSLLADYFVLCNADSTPQFRAIVDQVLDQTRAVDVRPMHVEGQPESGWVLIDFSSVVLHIFDPKLRAYYDLEGLWKKARLVMHMM